MNILNPKDHATFIVALREHAWRFLPVCVLQVSQTQRKVPMSSADAILHDLHIAFFVYEDNS